MMQTSLQLDLLDNRQVIAYNKLVSENGGILWMKVGRGKTRPALLAAQDIAKDYPYIVVVARRKAFYDWKQEIATLQMKHRVVEAEDWVNESDDTPITPTIVLISEGKLNSPFTGAILDGINNEIGCIIVDEGWLYKNPKAQRHQMLRLFTEEHPTCVLSGSIMTAQDIVDIYGQVAISGRAKVLAPTLTKFRGKFQNGIQGHYLTWMPKPGAYKEIMELIEPFTYLYMPKKDDVDEITRFYKVLPSKQQLELFKELKETAAIEGAFELNNMANIVTKAQQISNGWLQHAGGSVRIFPSPKVDRLVLLLHELLQTDYKVVVWCAFKYDIERINVALYDAFRVWGGSRTPIYENQIATLQSGQEFDMDKWKHRSCRICLATEASGSSVNHFAQVPYAIYFSQDFKYHSLQQSKGRHTRRSSEHDTAYYLFMHTERSMDARVYWSVQRSSRAEESALRHLDAAQWFKELEQA